MDVDKLTSLALRLFFTGAFLVLALAVVEKGLNLIGQGVPGFFRRSYCSGRSYS